MNVSSRRDVDLRVTDDAGAVSEVEAVLNFSRVAFSPGVVTKRACVLSTPSQLL